jgi:hypothetical protein
MLQLFDEQVRVDPVLLLEDQWRLVEACLMRSAFPSWKPSGPWLRTLDQLAHMFSAVLALIREHVAAQQQGRPGRRTSPSGPQVRCARSPTHVCTNAKCGLHWT